MSDATLPLAWSVEGRRGPPLVFLHGFGAHRRFWDPWLPDLSGDHRCFTIDLPGFGEAPAPPDGDYSPFGLAAPVVALIERLDLSGVTLVGHSMGGGVALLVALALLDRAADAPPSRLAGLVSVAGAAYAQREPPFIRLARRGALASAGFAMLPKRWLVRTAMQAIVVRREAVTPGRVEAYARPMREPARRRAFLRCARALVPDDLDRITDRYREIDVPALCLWGRQDPVVPPAVGRRLADVLPRGRLELLDDCGHQVVEELPERSLDVLRPFLAGVYGPSSDPGSVPPGSEAAGSKPPHR